MLVLQIIASGILLGGIYALISVGLNLIFGVIKIVNLAHGEFLMLGMYGAFFLFSSLSISPYLATLIIFPLFMVLGYLVFRFIIKPLLGTHETEVNTILVSSGLGFVLQNLALMLWSADYRAIETAGTGKSINLGGVMLSSGRMSAFLICVVICVALYFLLMHTRLGTQIRAVSQDADAAILMGINVRRIYSLTFAAGIGLVGVAGCIILPIFNVYPNVGTYFNTLSFVIVVLGGLGSFTGALLGGLIIGLVETVAGVVASAELAQVFSLVLFLMILFVKPEGLLGKGSRV